MSSRIEWTDETWNPVVGCSNVSPGCDHCYAATVASRQLQPAHEGLTIGREWNGTVRLLEDRLTQPSRWRQPRRVFVNSMSDLFHHDVPADFIARVWFEMAHADRHTFQVLTKRPQRMASVLRSVRRCEMGWLTHDGSNPYGHNDAGGLDHGIVYPDHKGWPLPNVWLGTSIEADKYTFRADHLRATPAALRFLSLEPLLGPLPSLDLADIDWVIVGGESGQGARPMDPAWVRDIRDRCIEAGVAFHFKQWGEWGIGGWAVGVQDGPMARMGKRNSGRSIDGRTWDEFPAAVSA